MPKITTEQRKIFDLLGAANDGLWQTANVTDWVKFDNQLGNTALALFLAAQARRLRLDRLARERAEIVAARQAQNGR